MEVAGCFYIRVAGEVLSSSLLHMYIADKEVDVYAAISYIFPCAYIRKHYSKPIYFIWMELAQMVGGKASHRNGSDKISVDPCPCISLILRINATNFVREEYIQQSVGSPRPPGAYLGEGEGAYLVEKGPLGIFPCFTLSHPPGG